MKLKTGLPAYLGKPPTNLATFQPRPLPLFWPGTRGGPPASVSEALALKTPATMPGLPTLSLPFFAALLPFLLPGYVMPPSSTPDSFLKGRFPSDKTPAGYKHGGSGSTHAHPAASSSFPFAVSCHLG